MDLVLDHTYTLYTVSVPLLGPALDISVEVDGVESGWSVEGSDLVIDYQKPAGTHSIRVTYYTDLVTYTERGYLFSLVHTAPAPTRLQVAVVLPEHAAVSGTMPVSPRPSLSSDGQSIILSWERELAADEAFSATGMYSAGSDASWILVLAVAAVFFLLVIVIAGVLLFFRQQKKADGKVLKVLSEDERTVYSKVKEVPGITQREVEEFTGFSKAKLSKLVRNLEIAGLLEKQPYRKTNKLRVKA